MTKIRVNPATGEVAQFMASGRWAVMTAAEEGPRVTLLTSEEVAGWPDAMLAPKSADPEFLFALACTTCEPHPMTTDVHERDRLVDAHGPNDHRVAPYAVKLQHPDRESDSAPLNFEHGAEVTFWGSTTGEVAHLVDAVVVEAFSDHVDSEGETVGGYDVAVDGRVLFVPEAAVNGHAVREA